MEYNFSLSQNLVANLSFFSCLFEDNIPFAFVLEKCFLGKIFEQSFIWGKKYVYKNGIGHHQFHFQNLVLTPSHLILISDHS